MLGQALVNLHEEFGHLYSAYQKLESEFSNQEHKNECIKRSNEIVEFQKQIEEKLKKWDQTDYRTPRIPGAVIAGTTPKEMDEIMEDTCKRLREKLQAKKKEFEEMRNYCYSQLGDQGLANLKSETRRVAHYWFEAGGGIPDRIQSLDYFKSRILKNPQELQQRKEMLKHSFEVLELARIAGAPPLFIQNFKETLNAFEKQIVDAERELKLQRNPHSGARQPYSSPLQQSSDFVYLFRNDGAYFNYFMNNLQNIPFNQFEAIRAYLETQKHVMNSWDSSQREIYAQILNEAIRRERLKQQSAPSSAPPTPPISQDAWQRIAVLENQIAKLQSLKTNFDNMLKQDPNPSRKEAIRQSLVSTIDELLKKQTELQGLKRGVPPQDGAEASRNIAQAAIVCAATQLTPNFHLQRAKRQPTGTPEASPAEPRKDPGPFKRR